MSKRGRPFKKDAINADSHLCIRFDQDTRNALVCLASDWNVSASEAIRRAIKTCAKWDLKK